VRLLKSKGSWKLVSNSAHTYVWTDQRNLRRPKGVLILDPASSMARELPKSALDWQTLKEEIERTKSLALKKECPPHLSQAEQDFVIDIYNIDETDIPVTEEALSYFRVKAYRECLASKKRISPVPLKTGAVPSMKAKTCACYRWASDIGSEAETMSADDWTKLWSKTACSRLQYHFTCMRKSSGTEGDNIDDSVACPFNCF
jgi:hypothetical protein